MFEFFISAFNIILYQPLFNALVLFYKYLPGNDFGIAIIVLTILTKLIISPFAVQGIKSQKVLQELQPKVQEIQKKFGKDKEKQAKALMELYKNEKVNPLSGCLPLLIQLPIFIALYRLFWNGFQAEQMQHLYSFISNPGVINTSFLGILDLSQPSVILAILTGILQLVQTKMLSPQMNKEQGSGFAQIMQKQMLYIFPLFTIVILLKFPAALALYWITMVLFTIVQQYIILETPTNKA